MASQPDSDRDAVVEITNLKQLQTVIVSRQDDLSKRLKQVAAWLLEHPNQAAFSTLAEIADSAGVHASTLVRFANFFGFTGFSGLQKLYKQDLLENTNNYQQRIERVTQVSNPVLNDPANLLQEFANANMMSMELLRAQANPELLNAAVKAMVEAKDIYICGFRRVYSVAHYMHYTLSRLCINNVLVTATGGMLGSQLQWLNTESLMIAITYKPYTQLTEEAVRKASEKGAKILLITDSELCPVASLADYLFIVREAEARAFRSLSATHCLAQTLCLSLGYQKQG